MNNVKEAQGNMMEIGIVLILALIGITNYINTFIGNIRSHTAELSIMKSIGMTEKQMKNMLVLEGFFTPGVPSQ